MIRGFTSQFLAEQNMSCLAVTKLISLNVYNDSFLFPVYASRVDGRSDNICLIKDVYTEDINFNDKRSNLFCSILYTPCFYFM